MHALAATQQRPTTAEQPNQNTSAEEGAAALTIETAQS
eukprot:COSAG03_NODE_7794_length_872_cov_1.510996_2_plen_37_part_01